MIGIIHTGNALKEPYFEKYRKALDLCGASYELVVWDRKGNSIKDEDGVHVFHKKTSNVKRLSKIRAFCAYCRFVRRTVQERGYDKLIFLNTMSAFALGRFIKSYAGRYVFDVRDMSYERLPLFKRRMARIIKNSDFTSISSDGFRDEMPDLDYVRSHNYTYTDLAKEVDKRQKSDPIKVVYVGVTRGDKFNLRLIEAFGGDERFTLRIAGEGADTETVKEKARQFKNVTVTGRYENEQKGDILTSSDMLVNMNIGSFNGSRLTSNKYYDGLIYKLPQIARADEYTGALVSVKGVGVALDVMSEELADHVYEYYSSLDLEEFVERAKAELERVKREDEKFLDAVKDFIS